MRLLVQIRLDFRHALVVCGPTKPAGVRSILLVVQHTTLQEIVYDPTHKRVGSNRAG